MTKVIRLFEKNGLVDDSNREIITFGLNKLVGTLLMLCFTIFIACLFGDFLVGVLFEVGFIALRRFVGGYHAETQRKCLVLTYISTFLCVTAIFFVPINFYIMGIIIVLFNVAVFYRAPIENKNKPLSATEKKIYRRKAILISVLLSVLFFAFNYTKMYIYSKTIFVLMLLVLAGMFDVKAVFEKNESITKR